MPVSIGLHQKRPARSAVSSRAADLLVIILYASRQSGMDHGAHVRVINSHPKCDSCYHHLDLAAQKLFLHSSAMIGIQPGVIRRSRTVTRDFGGDSLGLLSR